jgi:hypothetical protein
MEVRKWVSGSSSASALALAVVFRDKILEKAGEPVWIAMFWLLIALVAISILTTDRVWRLVFAWWFPKVTVEWPKSKKQTLEERVSSLENESVRPPETIDSVGLLKIEDRIAALEEVVPVVKAIVDLSLREHLNHFDTCCKEVDKAFKHSVEQLIEADSKADVLEMQNLRDRAFNSYRTASNLLKPDRALGAPWPKDELAPADSQPKGAPQIRQELIDVYNRLWVAYETDKLRIRLFFRRAKIGLRIDEAQLTIRKFLESPR